VCGTPLTPFCYFLLSSTPTIDTEPKITSKIILRVAETAKTG